MLKRDKKLSYKNLMDDFFGDDLGTDDGLNEEDDELLFTDFLHGEGLGEDEVSEALKAWKHDTKSLRGKGSNKDVVIKKQSKREVMSDWRTYNFTNGELTLLLRWAEGSVNYSAELDEFADTEGKEALFNNLPPEIVESNGECLVDDIYWDDVEDLGEIREGYRAEEATDMQSGSHVFMLYKDGAKEIAKTILHVFASSFSEEEYEALTGEPYTDDVDMDFLYTVSNQVYEDEGLVYLDPNDKRGGIFEFLGRELYRDEEGNTYV